MRSKSKSSSPAALLRLRRRSQSYVLDRIASDPSASPPTMTLAYSLHPDAGLALAAACGSIIALAIVDAWAFRAPVSIAEI
jgi:hypothetical protein